MHNGVLSHKHFIYCLSLPTNALDHYSVLSRDSNSMLYSSYQALCSVMSLRTTVQNSTGIFKTALTLDKIKMQKQKCKLHRAQIIMIVPFIQSTTCLGVHLLIGSITRAIIRSLNHSHQNQEKKRKKNLSEHGWDEKAIGFYIAVQRREDALSLQVSPALIQ